MMASASVRRSGESPGLSWKSASYVVAAMIALFGFRLYFVITYSDAAPFWDEWDAILDGMLVPMAKGHFSLGTLFSAHNEHRILFTRLIVLCLVWFNDGQFDGRVECVFNIFLACGAASVFLVAMLRQLPSRLHGVYALVFMLMLAAPYAWENIIGGFQSQFYVLTVFSVASIWIAAARDIGVRHVIWMFLLTLCAMFSMASGTLAALTIVGIAVVRRIDGSITPRATTLIVVSQGMLVAAGLATIPHTSADALHAQGIGEILGALHILLSWPLKPHWLFAFGLWAPGALLVVRSIRALWRREPLPTAWRVFLAVLGWICLQLLAMAYSRGHGITAIAPRYLDLIVLGTGLNLAILFHVSFDAGNLTRRWARIGVAIYGACILKAIALSVVPSVNSMAERYQGTLHAAAVMRGYLATGDALILDRKPGLFAYPDAERVRRSLDDPTYAGLMPAEIRRPLPLTWANCAGFVSPGWYPSTSALDGPKTLGSFSALGNAGTGNCESMKIKPATRFVSFWTSGYFHRNGDLDLTIVDDTGKRHSAAPSQAPAERWLRQSVRAPHEMRVLASDKSPDGWFAFSAPVETGRLTARIDKLERNLPATLTTLAALATALLIAAAFHRRVLDHGH